MTYTLTTDDMMTLVESILYVIGVPTLLLAFVFLVFASVDPGKPIPELYKKVTKWLKDKRNKPDSKLK